MSRPLRAEIRLSSLQHNLQRARAAAPHSQVMAAIKANAYGHGMARVAHALHDVDAFAVASIDEAIILRESGVHKSIVLLEGMFSADELLLVQAYDVQLVVHDVEQVEWLESAQIPRPLTIWMKVDTGMHRLGIEPAAFADLYLRLSDCEAVGEIRFMTHFACADETGNPATTQQIKDFADCLGKTEGQRSLANSAGILAHTESHADWIRPGIMLYGSSPLQGETAASLGLEPVMTLTSRLIAVNNLRKGDSVGYGAEWTCPEDMPVGVVACGYGDGYPRHAKEGTPVLVNGQRVPLIGRVSMDMLTVDLRGIKAQLGDEVVLWGDGLPADEVADSVGTIAYELFCHVTARVPFVEV
jgi:alanine racemase